MMSINNEESGSYAALDTRAMGICATCIDVDTCTSRRNWHGPVHFCEEFCDAIAVTHADVYKGSAQQKPSRTSKKPAVSKAKGLCINCEHREDCLLPKHESGVWHCEEYS